MFTEDDLKIVYKNGVADGIDVVQEVNLAADVLGDEVADAAFKHIMLQVQKRYMNLPEAITTFLENCAEEGVDPLTPMYQPEVASV